MCEKDFKTVREVSELLDTTPQTIYNYIKKIDDKYILKHNNKTVITTSGIEKIKSIFNENNNISVKTEDQELFPTSNELISVLKEELEYSKQQIAEKDKQIQSLLNTNNELVERLKENNYIMASRSLNESVGKTNFDTDEGKVSFFTKIKNIFRS